MITLSGIIVAAVVALAPGGWVYAHTATTTAAAAAITLVSATTSTLSQTVTTTGTIEPATEGR